MPTRELLLDGTRDGVWTAILVGAVVVAAVCLALLFQYERRLVPRRLGVGLLGLRLSAVGVVLLALLEPQLRTTYERQQTGRIVVAVDVSHSMETADKSLSNAEALRLARALGMIGNAATQPQLDAWLDAFEHNREPEWVTHEEAADADRAAALGDARRRSLAAMRDELSSLPRTEIVRRLLSDGRTNLLDRLGDIGVVERRVFAAGISETTPDSFDAALAGPAESLGLESSDLAQPLLNDGSDAPLTAVVILSDGRDNVHRDASPLVAAARSAGAPVYPVLIGAQHRPQDIAVTSIDAPAAVFLDDRPAVRVSLRTTGFAGRPLDVTLTAEGDDAAAAPITQTITPQADAAEVRFDLQADAIGRRRYSVTVAPQPGETRADNNSRNFAIQVVNDRARVLLVDNDARWEFRYLAAALERDQRVELDPVLFQQPYLGLLPDTFFPRRLSVATETDDNGAATFDDYDAVLIGDVDPQQFPPDIWSELERYVRESGGTLVLMSGKHHMPLGYRGEALSGLLPVEDLQLVGSNALDAVRPPEARGFRLQITPDGEAAGVLTLDSDPQRNRRIWSTLPGHTWGLRGRAKPGSTVWATAIRPDEQPDLQAEREAAVIVEQNLGAGRVLWIGIDSTWRWRSHTGDLYHHRFWGQLVRGAAEFKAAVHNDVVQFGPDRPQIEFGESATFRARWSEQFLRQHPDLHAGVRLTRIDGTDDGAVSAPLVAKPDRPHEFEVQIPGLAPGEYRARLVAENAGEETADISAEIAVVAKSTPERDDVTANRPLLERIAEASGGALLLPDQLPSLPDRLRKQSTSEQLSRTVSLWSHWSVLALFCGLVGTEWLLRKLNGLP